MVRVRPGTSGWVRNGVVASGSVGRERLESARQVGLGRDGKDWPVGHGSAWVGKSGRGRTGTDRVVGNGQDGRDEDMAGRAGKGGHGRASRLRPGLREAGRE